MSSQRSSTIKSSNASSPNEETKYKSNDVIQGFNMTIANKTVTSRKPPPLVRRHSSVTSRSAEHDVGDQKRTDDVIAETEVGTFDARDES